MTSPKTERFRLSVQCAGVVGLLAAGLAPAAAQQPQLPQGWFKACTKQEEVDICNVQNIVTASNGQLVTGISLIELKGKINRRVFQVTVPTGRLLPPGLQPLQAADLAPGGMECVCLKAARKDQESDGGN